MGISSMREVGMSKERAMQKSPGKPRYWVAFKTRNPERTLALKLWDEDGSKVLLVALALG